MNELKTEIRDKWNSTPENYDSAHAHGINDETEIARWTELFSDKQGQSILDVGCGTGFVSLIAAKCGLDVTGVDWSTGMMGQAKKKADEQGLKIHFVVGDTEGLPFLDESFQNLSSRHVIWTLTDPEGSFREWYRVLRKGGCVMADYSPKKEPEKAQHYRLEVEKQLPLNRNIAPEVIEGMFRNAGFCDIRIVKRAYSHGDENGKGTEHANYLFVCTK